MSNLSRTISLTLTSVGFTLSCVAADMTEPAPPVIRLDAGALEPPIARAGRLTTLEFQLTNTAGPLNDVRLNVDLPSGVRVEGERPSAIGQWEPGETKDFRIPVRAEDPVEGSVGLTVTQDERTISEHRFPARWRQAVEAAPAKYPPPPQPADTGPFLVGAFMCPLWKEGVREDTWGPIRSYPERKPALGWYDEGRPEVTDWEIKWALEHGISFFVPCWYRAKDNLGKPVRPVLDHWVHEGLFNSRYGDQFQFAIMWENGNPIACGVESEADLLNNLLPYWIERYFSRPNYLRIDGKPVLFIYRLEVLVEELGGLDETRRAVAKMRSAVRDAGLEGLVVLGEHHGRLKQPLPELASTGLDYAFSYHWPTFSGTMRARDEGPAIIEAQREAWRQLPEVSGLPALLTVSMGWDSRPWGASHSKAAWRLTPAEFETLLRKARRDMEAHKGAGPPARMLLIDNWNEFGEGHYIFPHRQYGFGYLEAVRRVFAPEAGPHASLVPEDVGLGPYHGKKGPGR